MAEQFCFINEKRPCTNKCKASYEVKGMVYCGILWVMHEMGEQAFKFKKKRKK